MTPRVSVIMPCFNAQAHLMQSIGSVLAQSVGDWELIAVDDGSRDATLKTLRDMTDPRIRVLAQANQGVSAARNTGLSAARTEFVAFLDADDTWSPVFLEHMLAALGAQPEAVLSYCGWQKLGVEGRRGAPFVPPDYERPDKAETLFTGCRWPIHAVVVRRAAVIAAGGFDLHLKNAEDFALWLRVASEAPIVRVPEVLAYYHFHSDTQASANKGRAALHHFRAQQEYLKRNPALLKQLGKRTVRRLMLAELLERGYTCYWQRDLAAARKIFRVVMRQCYGSFRDWLYMLPSWIPEAWHRRLLGLRDGPTAADDA